MKTFLENHNITIVSGKPYMSATYRVFNDNNYFVGYVLHTEYNGVDTYQPFRIGGMNCPVMIDYCVVKTDTMKKSLDYL